MCVPFTPYDFASRKKQEIESILHILSPLEKSAVKQVIQRIEQGEGTIVTSRLAKEVGITLTVIVNALKKVESAGLIQFPASYGSQNHLLPKGSIWMQRWQSVFWKFYRQKKM